MYYDKCPYKSKTPKAVSTDDNLETIADKEPSLARGKKRKTADCFDGHSGDSPEGDKYEGNDPSRESVKIKRKRISDKDREPRYAEHVEEDSQASSKNPGNDQSVVSQASAKERVKVKRKRGSDRDRSGDFQASDKNGGNDHSLPKSKDSERESVEIKQKQISEASAIFSSDNGDSNTESSDNRLKAKSSIASDVIVLSSDNGESMPEPRKKIYSYRQKIARKNESKLLAKNDTSEPTSVVRGGESQEHRETGKAVMGETAAGIDTSENNASKDNLFESLDTTTTPVHRRNWRTSPEKTPSAGKRDLQTKKRINRGKFKDNSDNGADSKGFYSSVLSISDDGKIEAPVVSSVFDGDYIELDVYASFSEEEGDSDLRSSEAKKVRVETGAAGLKIGAVEERSAGRGEQRARDGDHASVHPDRRSRVEHRVEHRLEHRGQHQQDHVEREERGEHASHRAHTEHTHVERRDRVEHQGLADRVEHHVHKERLERVDHKDRAKRQHAGEHGFHADHRVHVERENRVKHQNHVSHHVHEERQDRVANKDHMERKHLDHKNHKNHGDHKDHEHQNRVSHHVHEERQDRVLHKERKDLQGMDRLEHKNRTDKHEDGVKHRESAMWEGQKKIIDFIDLDSDEYSPKKPGVVIVKDSSGSMNSAVGSFKSNESGLEGPQNPFIDHCRKKVRDPPNQEKLGSTRKKNNEKILVPNQLEEQRVERNNVLGRPRNVSNSNASRPVSDVISDGEFEATDTNQISLSHEAGWWSPIDKEEEQKRVPFRDEEPASEDENLQFSNLLLHPGTLLFSCFYILLL